MTKGFLALVNGQECIAILPLAKAYWGMYDILICVK